MYYEFLTALIGQMLVQSVRQGVGQRNYDLYFWYIPDLLLYESIGGVRCISRGMWEGWYEG